MGILISTERLWLPVALESSPMRNQIKGHPGILMGLDGYYLGPALDHYRCYQVHITKTKGTRIVDTIEFPPAKLAMSRTSSKYLASIAAIELSNALENPAPVALFSQIGSHCYWHCRYCRLHY
jgi:hypothetical protein